MSQFNPTGCDKQLPSIKPVQQNKWTQPLYILLGYHDIKVIELVQLYGIYCAVIIIVIYTIVLYN